MSHLTIGALVGMSLMVLVVLPILWYKCHHCAVVRARWERIHDTFVA